VTKDLAAADAHFNASRWDEAAQGYDVVVEADPSRARAWFQLGYALHAAGQLERACTVHEKATEFPAFAPVAAYNLGCAKALLGHPEEAFAALERSIALGFNNVAQLDGDTDLVSLRGDARWAKLRAGVVANSAPAAGAANPAAPELRQMDFWVGDWDVTSAGGQVLGTNAITADLNGFLILEEWTNAGGGGRGKSMNYWDRDAKLWRQVWVSAGGNVLQMAGTFTDGALRFEGENMYANGATVKHKTTLKPLADGRVHQHIEESKDGGKTWQVGFDGYYAKRKAQ
jgi:tetratricopeptide (TPR) repeat protein